MLLLLIAGFAYAKTYQPLVANGGSLYSVNGPEGSNVVAGASGYSLGTIRYRDGAIEIWGINIRNDGRFAVTITGAQWPYPGVPFSRVTFLLPTEAVEQGTAAIGPTSGLQQLQPFTLAHGQQRTIYVRFVMSGCTVPSPANSIFVDFGADSVDVDIRALGVSHTVAISAGPDGGFQISVPGNASCRQGDGTMQPLIGG